MNCKSEAIIAAQEVLDAIKTCIDEVQKELDEANETLAQRAPVEQGRSVTDAQTEDERQATDSSLSDARRKSEQNAGANPASAFLSIPEAAAPDHAREGALRLALEALAKVWDEESSMSHDSAPSLCAVQLRRALADGKEGGE